MYIETDSAIYDIDFSQVQIEITGVCNMKCRHCRGSFDQKSDMPVAEIEKILGFALKNSNGNLEVVLSGGEPFLHKEFARVLELLEKMRVKKLYITTNGSIPIEPYLDFFSRIDTMISVSLDSTSAQEHDSFRNYAGAYEKALETIGQLRDGGINFSVRSSLLPKNINQISDMAAFVYDLGVKRLAISSIMPIGRALDADSMLMTQNEKKKFLMELFALREIYLPKGMKITTNDPLQNICRYRAIDCHELFTDEIEPTAKCKTCCNLAACFPANDGGVLIEGCTGGVTNFNVFANGNLTPCAILDMKIINIFETDAADIERLYISNDIVKNLAERTFKGKCGTCSLKYVCGGCRARAKNTYGDYLAEDPDCWK